MRWITVLLVVAMATAASAKEPASKGKAKPAARSKTTSGKQTDGAGTAETAAAAFPRFCEEWMGKLAERERENIAHIKWEPSSVGVHGIYTGYSSEHSCVTKAGTDAVPVGRLTYMELRYEKEGKTEGEAATSTPRALETIEVTEIFRYGGGKWLY